MIVIGYEDFKMELLEEVHRNRKKEDEFLVIIGERFFCMTIHDFLLSRNLLS